MAVKFMITARSTSHRVRLAIALGIAMLSACSQDATRVQLTIEADTAWRLDNYQLRVATTAATRSARADVQRALTVVVPDEMAGNAATIDVWGLAIGQQVAHGTVTVTPSLHGSVSATVTLTAVSCGLWCEPGAVACDHDGVTTCEQQSATGCVAWSPSASCPSAMPYCSNGTCAAQCSDECSMGGSVCDSAVAVRACGQFDSDPCLDVSPPSACPSGESCTNGSCMGTVACGGDGAACDDGNACTIADTCDGATCSGTPKCTNAPSHAEPRCASDGSCGFVCQPGYMKSGTICVFVPPADMPTARDGLAAATGSDGTIYAIGGSNGNDLRIVEAYLPGTSAWDARAPISSPRSDLAAVRGSNGHIYAIGGHSNGSDVATVEAYDPSTNMWMMREPMPTAREFLAVAAGSDGKIYAIGGRANGGALATVEAYDPVTNKWSARAPMPTPRFGLAAVAAPDGKIYAIGGLGQTFLDTVEAYDPASNMWTTRAVMPTRRWALAAATGFDGKIYAFGGTNNGYYLASVEAYDPAANTWAACTSMPTSRAFLATTVAGHLIYAIGGAHTYVLSTVEAYDPATDTWP